MTIALDVGAKRIRSLQREGNELVARSRPAACCFLPDKPSVRHLLGEAVATYASTGDQLVIWGRSAEELSERCAVKTEHLLVRNPLRKDRRSVAEPLHHSIAELLPPASPGAVCCLGATGDEFHADWLEAEVTAMGYRIVTCPAGLALGLAELVREQFTGIAMVFGGSRSEAVFVKDGRLAARCELPRGGDAIDQSIAIAEDRYWWSMSGFRELDTDGITRWKESLSHSLTEPADPRGERLLAGYHQLVGELTTLCESAFPIVQLPDRLAVIAGGGAARIPGFEDVLKQHLAESMLPIDLDKIRIESGEDTIPRGLLIQAELQKDDLPQPHAA